MAKKIEAVLTSGQREQLAIVVSAQATTDVQEILTIIQQLVDANIGMMSFDEINFIPIQAIPNRKEHELVVSFLLINLTYKTINALTGHMSIQLKDENLTVNQLEWDLDEGFLGDWEAYQAILVTQKVPYKGRPTKRNYVLDDIESKIEDVKVINK